MEEQRTCSYCFRAKPISEFSYEHIWPEGLGGDHLPSLWQTKNVCGRCNNLAGLFVDGEFIKSWMGSSERSAGDLDFLDPSNPERGKLSLFYMGYLTSAKTLPDEVAEFWLGPCGAHIVHIRPKHEPLWDTYAGGKPSRKRSDWGSAYLALTSMERFWIIASVTGFHNHFKYARRFVTNMNTPQGFLPPFSVIDRNDPEQLRHLGVAKSIAEAASIGDMVQIHTSVKIDLGVRLLSKVALGLGRELLGVEYLNSSYADVLRQALWERDSTKRSQLPIRGSGYLSAFADNQSLKFLHSPGVWTLVIWNMAKGLIAIIATPLGKLMTVLISDEPSLVSGLNERYIDGEVFLTVPALGYAPENPISLPDYIAHKTGIHICQDLILIDDARRDPTLLPKCS